MRDHKYKIVNSCNGFLCLCDPSNDEPIVVCNPVIGEFINFPEDRRTKDFDSPIACGFGFSPTTNQYKVIKMWRGIGAWGSYQPIKYLDNGALLLYNSHEHIFVYHNPKNLGYRYLEVRGMQSKVEAISQTPSFVSLKDVVSAKAVLNVRSRCGELKLYKEGKGISILEQIKDRHCDCGCEETYGDDSE